MNPTIYTRQDAFGGSVDDIAEREAAAIERFYTLMGDVVPMGAVAIARSVARDTADLPPVRRYPYGRIHSYRAHRKIESATMAYLVYGPRDRYPHFDDPATRQAKLLRRARKLFELQHAQGSEWVGLAKAARLTAIGERTLQRAAANGRLPAHKDFTPTPKNGLGRSGRWLVRIADVRSMLQLKLA